MSRNDLRRAARSTLCAMLAMAAAAMAQESYPAKPISLVVPFPPGGVADIVARPTADAMSRYLKQPVVIENKPGAGGGIGMGYVAKAKPDGYTVLMALSSISILPEADKITGRAAMYQFKDFTPIARCAPTAPGARWTNSSRMRASGRARSPTARRATTARCTCRWRCSRRRR